MKKARLLILMLLFAFSLLTVTGCKRDTPTVEITLASLEVTAYPKQYYTQYEALDITAGKLLATYSDGTTKELNFTDEGVTVKDYGTKVLEYLYDLNITYMGKTVTVNYFVSATVRDVTFDPKAMQVKYSLGGKIDYSDAVFTLVKATSTSTMTATRAAAADNGLYKISGFDTSAVGEKTMKVQYYATVFNVSYTVVEQKFVLTSVLNGDSIVVIYFIGEALDLGEASITSYYSDGTAAQFPVTASMVTGFDTSAENTAGAQMTVSYAGLGTADDFVLTQTVTYYVYQQTAIESIKMILSAGEANYNVNEPLKLNKTYLEVTLNTDDVKGINLSNPRVSLSGFTSAVRTDTPRYITVTYMISETVSLTTTLQYFVTPMVQSMEVLYADTIKQSYTVGEIFSFGEAEMKITYNDGISEYYNLQEEFEKPIEERYISIYTLDSTTGTSVYTKLTPANIDMTVGDHRILAGWSTLDTTYTVTAI